MQKFNIDFSRIKILQYNLYYRISSRTVIYEVKYNLKQRFHGLISNTKPFIVLAFTEPLRL